MWSIFFQFSFIFFSILTSLKKKNYLSKWKWYIWTLNIQACVVVDNAIYHRIRSNQPNWSENVFVCVCMFEMACNLCMLSKLRLICVQDVNRSPRTQIHQYKILDIDQGDIVRVFAELSWQDNALDFNWINSMSSSKSFQFFGIQFKNRCFKFQAFSLHHPWINIIAERVAILKEKKIHLHFR